jgi:hypothetical protein
MPDGQGFVNGQVMRQKIAADENGLRFFPGNGLK